MNYKESIDILKKIEKADNILLNCHRGPDPDGIGSSLALKAVLEKMGKSVDVICPSNKISSQVDYLRDYKDIKTGIDFNNFPFDVYDLFISLDTPNLSLMTGSDKSKEPKIDTVIIDHHYISTTKGGIRLIDEKATSVGEMLYLIFEDWVIDIDKNISECLLTSIIGDTGALAYPNVTPQTLRITAKLMDMGVNKDVITSRIYRNEDFSMIKFWSEVLSLTQIDKEHKFIYAFIPYEVYSKYENLDDAKAKTASLFAPIVSGTNFGFIAVEEKPKYVSISLRGRTEFDTSKIAKELGGGGHKVASAAKIENISFDEASEKILSVARKYAKEK